MHHVVQTVHMASALLWNHTKQLCTGPEFPIACRAASIGACGTTSIILPMGTIAAIIITEVSVRFSISEEEPWKYMLHIYTNEPLKSRIHAQMVSVFFFFFNANLFWIFYKRCHTYGAWTSQGTLLWSTNAVVLNRSSNQCEREFGWNREKSASRGLRWINKFYVGNKKKPAEAIRCFPSPNSTRMPLLLVYLIIVNDCLTVRQKRIEDHTHTGTVCKWQP